MINKASIYQDIKLYYQKSKYIYINSIAEIRNIHPYIYSQPGIPSEGPICSGSSVGKVCVWTVPRKRSSILDRKQIIFLSQRQEGLGHHYLKQPTDAANFYFSAETAKG